MLQSACLAHMPYIDASENFETIVFKSGACMQSKPKYDRINVNAVAVAFKYGACNSRCAKWFFFGKYISTLK